MDPADPRRAAVVPIPGGGRRLDRFLSFRAAVLPLCRDHARPRPVSDLCGVQSIAAIAVTRARHLPWRSGSVLADFPAAFAFSPGESMVGWREVRGRPTSAVARTEDMKPVSSIGWRAAAAPAPAAGRARTP